MIISFRFKNFRSFLDETFINMNAINYNELPSHLISAGNRKLIKTLAVYDASASGKTNLFLALACFHSLIFGQLFSTEMISPNHFMSLFQLSNMNKIEPFQTTGANPHPTEMELTFISSQRIYEYSFTICGQEVLAEHLTVDHHVIFTRTEGELSIGRQFERPLRQWEKLGAHNNQLFCSVLSCLNIPEITAVMEPFKNFFFEQIFYHIDIPEPFQGLERMNTDRRIYKITEHSNALHYGLKQLQKIGIPAEAFVMEHGIPMLGYRIKSRATGQFETRYMDFTKISDSTIKYLSLFVKIYHLQSKGGILIIDNMSNEFRPVVMKLIVDTFQQESNKCTQLIFSTHDSSILNNQQFRRDEVAFVDMNEYQESRLYTLADIKVRSNAGFSGNYLLKKYGTISLVKDYFNIS
ncbi:ATP-binding protein [Lachnospiraceae bacterium 54-53]